MQIARGLAAPRGGAQQTPPLSQPPELSRRSGGPSPCSRRRCWLRLRLRSSSTGAAPAPSGTRGSSPSRGTEGRRDPAWVAACIHTGTIFANHLISRPTGFEPAGARCVIQADRGIDVHRGWTVGGRPQARPRARARVLDRCSRGAPPFGRPSPRGHRFRCERVPTAGAAACTCRRSCGNRAGERVRRGWREQFNSSTPQLLTAPSRSHFARAAGTHDSEAKRRDRSGWLEPWRQQMQPPVKPTAAQYASVPTNDTAAVQRALACMPALTRESVQEEEIQGGSGQFLELAEQPLDPKLVDELLDQLAERDAGSRKETLAKQAPS